MQSPHVTFRVAQQHIADLQRAADHDRLAHSLIDARATDTDPPARLVRRLRRRLSRPVAAPR